MSFNIDNPFSTIHKLKMIDTADPGEAKAGKALIVDSNKDISDINDVSLKTITIGDTEIDESEMLVISDVIKGEAKSEKALIVDSNKDISNIHNIKVDSLSMGNTTIKEENIQNLTDISANQISSLSNIVPGEVKGRKVLLANEDKDIGVIRNLSIDGTFSGPKYTFDTVGNISTLGTVNCASLDVDGTITGKTSLTLDDTTLNKSELAVLDGVSAGISTAGKALIVDSNNHIRGINKITVQDLDVQGTTTIVNTVIMNATNAIQFEGATSDSHETTLQIINPTEDQNIFLPNSSGYLPVLNKESTTAITATPEEINILDGVYSNYN